MTRSIPLPAPAPATRAPPRGWRWQRVRRVLLAGFALLVLALLVSGARDMDWAGAWRALRGYDIETLLLAGGLAALSHALYGSFDLLGRGYTGHRLSTARVWATAFVSYAFNLNLGSWVGALGLRLRLYSRAGLDGITIAQIIALALTTNWLGYGALAGVLFAGGLLDLPQSFALGNDALRVIGVLVLLIAAAYLWACAFSRRREGTLRGHRWRLPSGRAAALQLALSMSNWAVMGLIVYTLLGHAVPYPTVLAVLLAGAIAGVATHVPANLGVLEAIFLALLGGGDVPQATILGAVLAYRAIYYLVPMAFAIVSYFVLESIGRSR